MCAHSEHFMSGLHHATVLKCVLCHAWPTSCYYMKVCSVPSLAFQEYTILLRCVLCQAWPSRPTPCYNTKVCSVPSLTFQAYTMLPHQGVFCAKPDLPGVHHATTPSCVLCQAWPSRPTPCYYTKVCSVPSLTFQDSTMLLHQGVFCAKPDLPG